MFSSSVQWKPPQAKSRQFTHEPSFILSACQYCIYQYAHIHPSTHPWGARCPNRRDPRQIWHRVMMRLRWLPAILFCFTKHVPGLQSVSIVSTGLWEPVRDANTLPPSFWLALSCSISIYVFSSIQLNMIKLQSKDLNIKIVVAQSDICLIIREF